jgi:hypothetical protein
MSSNTLESPQHAALVREIEAGIPPEHAFEHSIDPAVEEAYWRKNYAGRPYVVPGATFNEYRPAFRYGVDAHRRFAGLPFDEAEPELMREWDRVKGTSSLTWGDARLAAHDAWQRVRDFASHGPGDPGDRAGRTSGPFA